jgi:tRNA uridine 5-carboxymethylaminomethyl modification enzyme
VRLAAPSATARDTVMTAAPAPPRTHPHPFEARSAARSPAYDVVVVGGGHAGVEAVLAASRLGVRAALVTFRADRIGEMSCNPAIGGLGKGQLAREVDALGGAMGIATDKSGIQFRMLNRSKGYAVQAPRAQADRHRYRDEVTALVQAARGVDVLEGGVERLLVDRSGAQPKVVGVVLADGREITATATILTTGTFLSGLMHTGERQTAGGRIGEAAAHGITDDLRALGLATGRLKTGTPPRLAADSIDWARLEPQPGDADPSPFSLRTSRAAFPALQQIDCHLAYTNERAHSVIRANLHRSPMYAGRIQGVGPRYCPSVEDKVVRFAERDRHQLFLEPESLSTDVIYVNGLSTSLPAEIQEELVHSIDGLERARFLRHGYAVEYDFVQPFQLDLTFALRDVPGLYLAGQINGTSGYEEAAAQGLVAGANAALWASGRGAFVLERHEAYTGVLVDDLTVSNPTEPYRMFSSRAEYRLSLRHDNADERLSERGAAVGLVDDELLAITRARRERIAAARTLLETLRSPTDGHRTFAEVLARPEVTFAQLAAREPRLAALALDDELMTAVEADVKYAGYVERQKKDVERSRRQETTEIPADFDFAAVSGLKIEARQQLAKLRPRTLGAAGRIAGVNPPDVALLAIHVERARRTK